MIDDLDEVLRQLLIREMPIKNNEIDIAFDQPKKEWSARLSRPTLNLYLYDVRENAKLRQTSQGWNIEQRADGTIAQQRRPVRVDLHYLMTVWATEPEDEHRLLTRALMALFRYQSLPKELLPESLREQPTPIPLKIAQYDTLDKPSDFWNVMDNQQRPAVVCVVTLALNPFQLITGPMVRGREVRIGQASEPARVQELVKRAGVHTFWSIGGRVHSQRPLADLRITLVERGEEVPVQPDPAGPTAVRFAVSNLEPGDYTLEISADGREASRHPITVPAPDYDLEI